jgi:hypothetical protein
VNFLSFMMLMAAISDVGVSIIMISSHDTRYLFTAIGGACAFWVLFMKSLKEK